MNPRDVFSRGPFRREGDDWAGGVSGGNGHGESVALPRADVARSDSSVVPTEEAALVARAKAGEQEAFAVLVRVHQRQVFNLAYRMLRDADDASEATQEVFLSAWQGLRTFRGDARFATWLYRIAYNHCLKVCESTRRDQAARAELVAAQTREHAPERRISALHAGEAESAVRESVRDGIASLPEKYQAVLVLRHLQDLSYEEMADVMRVPIGTVKTQLFRARAMLKERLEDLGRARDEGLARAGELRSGLEGSLRSFLERRLDPTCKGDAE